MIARYKSFTGKYFVVMMTGKIELMTIYGDVELYRTERRNGTVPTFQEFVRYLVSLEELVRLNT